MITVEDLLMAYASAYDAWLDPETERKNPTPEYAELIRQAVSFENAKLRELCKDMMAFVEDDDACERCGHDAECVEAADGELVLPYEGRCLMLDLFADRMRELGVEVDG